ncbi:MAG: protein-glutamate O-methyltransferase CheR [Fimbriimonadales bacterium]|nr:protein-glutamate O-methyltransferase CheR [Fimbriimonadales bacterium]
MHPSNEQWLTFHNAFRRRTGLDLAHYKQDQLRRRIVSMAETRGCKSLEEFWALLSASEKDLRWFQDKLAINVSELFRNPEKWEELRRRVLPELLGRSRSLKCWSAGCSYGAEAYSLAMTLDAWFPGAHSILGTDIDQAALAQANKGVFHDNDVRGVPEELKRRYLRRTEAGWEADPRLRRYLSFRNGDLLADRFDQGYDLILCRNVVIYFNDEAKDRLYRKFFQALKPGGVLFVGSTERIFNSQTIGFESTMPFFYRKPLGDLAWRNAS